MISAIILAAGSGSRMNAGKNKLLICVRGKTVIEHTLEKFVSCSAVDRIVLVHSEADKEFFKKLSAKHKNVTSILGGNSRTESVKNALSILTSGAEDIALIHDGARPFVTDKVIRNCIDCCKKHGSAVAVVQATDTVATASQDGEFAEYRDRASCVVVQTPQAFYVREILSAYAEITESDNFTDDGGVFAKYVRNPHLSEGDVINRKITYASDLELFGKTSSLRIGTGQDTHLFAENRKLILGGVTVPNDRGLAGHSDADALAHAVADSLLAAVCERDIGFHFPDSDDRYLGADSMKLLEAVRQMLEERSASIVNVSAVIVCDRPKLSPYIPSMQDNLAAVLKVDGKCVSVSATTTEGTETDRITVTATALVTRG